MEIDWFTVIAQVINFLIMVWLLKRFLYKPVLNAIDAREARIASQLTDAENKKAEAEREREMYEQKNTAFDQQREIQLSKVADEMKDERQKQLEKIRSDSQALRIKLETSLKEDQQKIKEEIRQRIQNEVLAIADKTLSDLGSVSLEQQVINVFLKHLNDMSEIEKKQFRDSFSTTDDTVLIKTAFRIDNSIRLEIENAVNKIMGRKMIFRYAEDVNLLSGVELSVRNYKLSWNVRDYLNDLEKHIGSSTADQYISKEENAI